MNSGGAPPFHLHTFQLKQKANLKGFTRDVTKGVDVVICDDQNVRAQEVQGFVVAAVKARYALEVVEFTAGLPEDPAQVRMARVGTILESLKGDVQLC